jgi:hypothetical protein
MDVMDLNESGTAGWRARNAIVMNFLIVISRIITDDKDMALLTEENGR